jgi:Na+-driven multidrug efflux pump
MFSFTLKRVFGRAIPLLIAGVLSTLMGFTDGVFLAHYDSNAFNALVLLLPVVTLIAALGTGIGVAFADQFTKMITVKGKAETLVVSSLLLFISCTIVTLACAVGFEYFWHEIINSNNILEKDILKNYARIYWFWIIPTYWFQAIMNIVMQWLTISMKLRKANGLLLLIAVTNTILNPLLIFYVNMGIKGAAIATCLSFLVGLVLFVYMYRKLLLKSLKAIVLYSKVIKTGFFGRAMRTQLINVLSVFAAMGVFSVGQVFFNQIAVNLGARALILYGIVEQIKTIVTIPSRGVTGAYLIEFANAIKSKMTENYYTIYWASTVIIGCIYVLGCILVWFFPGMINNIYNISESGQINVLNELFIYLIVLFLLAILPRASQVAFMSLEKGYLLFLQSVVFITSSIFLSKYYANELGIIGLLKGQVIGMAVTFLVFFPAFVYLMNKKINYDKRSGIITQRSASYSA